MSAKTKCGKNEKVPKRLRVYLAGPEVFQRNAEILGNAKKELCLKYGFEGIFPIDAEIKKYRSKRKTGYSISAANELLIKSCDLIIANMTPFRGISTDVGTAFEMGYARGIGLPVFAYTNVITPFLERTISNYQRKVQRDEEGNFRDSNNMIIENWGLSDNLMLDGSIFNSGGVLIKEYVKKNEQ